MAKSRVGKKGYLSISNIRKRIKKLSDEAIVADMLDRTSLMLKKLNEVEVLRSMLAEYEEEL